VKRGRQEVDEAPHLQRQEFARRVDGKNTQVSRAKLRHHLHKSAAFQILTNEKRWLQDDALMPERS